MNRSLAKAVALNRNLWLARRLWPGQIYREQQCVLKSLVKNYGLSVAAGDLQLLERRWYVTHAGLIRLAQRRGCNGICVELMSEFSDKTSCRWVFKATVYKRSASHGFAGFGDADPSNCSTTVHGAEMRVAETRAVNRALRKAYGIGLCSVEELGSISNLPKPAPAATWSDARAENGSDKGQPRLRDQLCLLVRKFNLDPTLVKAYAADFCGTETLSGASRHLVESFIAHLSASATQNRDALVCKLNSYGRPQEATQ
jgi:hypothetical protein